MRNDLVCPKCGGELVDRHDSSIWCKVKKMDKNRFECIGHLIEPVPYPFVSRWSMMNRTRSCGVFGLRDLRVEYRKNGEI